MADRMIVMNAGVAEQVGTPLEVYERPRTLFAAQFIGSPAMNILDAEIRNGRVMIGDTALCESAAREGPVKLGLRPEHVQPDAGGPLSLALQLSEPLGANTLLHGRLVEAGQAPFTASLLGVHGTSPGQEALRFTVDPSEIHLFDPGSQQRL